MVDVRSVAVLRSSPLAFIPPLVSSSCLVSKVVCELFLKMVLLSGWQPPQCLTHLSLVDSGEADLHARTTGIFYQVFIKLKAGHNIKKHTSLWFKK